jgi:hypothetical protein
MRSKNQGLLRPIQMTEARKTDSRDPGSRGARLAPWGFSTGVVDSLGEGFVWINPLDITALKKLEYSWDLFLRSQY